MDQELKAALEAAKKAQQDFRAANDAAEVERKNLGRISAETQAKLDKISAAIDEKMDAAQKRWDEIERRLNRGELFGGASDKAEAAALELKAFNRQIALISGAQRRSALTLEAYRERYKPAFEAYLRGGKSAVEVMGPEFMAALSVGSDPSGGYQVPVDITDVVVKMVYETSPIRQRAAVRKTGRDRIQIRRDIDKATLGGWVAERGSRGTTGTPQTPVPHEIPVHEAYAFPLISQQELDDMDMDLRAWLQQQLAEQFARDENAAFVSGNGVGKPRGFLTYAAGTPSKATFAVIQQVVTGKAASFADAPNGPDIFIDLMGAMKEDYLEGASWAMTRTTLAAARKLKDSQGHYQVQIGAGLQGRPGFEILGFPVDRFADMDELGANKLPIAFANWAKAYQIADHARGLSLLVDPYTQKPDVGFYTTKRVGGDVANFEAIKLAKCST